jgi:hypothetical protein
MMWMFWDQIIQVLVREGDDKVGQIDFLFCYGELINND